jgi:hypothetical protein
MNERIRELEGDANDYADAHWERKCPQWHQFYTEKFAELIVRECAWLVNENDISLPYGTFGELIKQHFGVEE